MSETTPTRSEYERAAVKFLNQASIDTTSSQLRLDCKISDYTFEERAQVGLTIDAFDSRGDLVDSNFILLVNGEEIWVPLEEFETAFNQALIEMLGGRSE